MSPLDRRLRRYALFAAAHAVLVVAVLAASVPAWTVSLTLLTALPFVFAWGHFHVDLVRNAAVDESARTRWRILFYLLPWSIAVYWLRHVRPREYPD